MIVSFNDGTASVPNHRSLIRQFSNKHSHPDHYWQRAMEQGAYIQLACYDVTYWVPDNDENGDYPRREVAKFDMRDPERKAYEVAQLCAGMILIEFSGYPDYLYRPIEPRESKTMNKYDALYFAGRKAKCTNFLAITPDTGDFYFSGKTTQAALQAANDAQPLMEQYITTQTEYRVIALQINTLSENTAKLSMTIAAKQEAKK